MSSCYLQTPFSFRCAGYAAAFRRSYYPTTYPLPIGRSFSALKCSESAPESLTGNYSACRHARWSRGHFGDAEKLLIASNDSQHSAWACRVSGVACRRSYGMVARYSCYHRRPLHFI